MLWSLFDVPHPTRSQHRCLCAPSAPETTTEEASPLDEVSFPSLDTGAIILGRIQKSEKHKEIELSKLKARAAIFDHHFNPDGQRTGRKTLAKLIKGPMVVDYYMEKYKDPLMVNVEGREADQRRQAANRFKGRKRRRPQPQSVSKADKSRAKPKRP
jgi:hypothetical protein